MARFHELVAGHVDDPGEVVVAIATDRGMFIAALLAAGYRCRRSIRSRRQRYRERHTTSGAKSDPGDAKVLADLARTDAHNHRPIAGDSELAEAVKVLARAHQSMIWTRQRQTNQLRSTLREFYPAALDAFDELADARRWPSRIAPTPNDGPAAVAIADRRGATTRRASTTHRSTSGRDPDGAPCRALAAPADRDAMGATVTAIVAVIELKPRSMRSRSSWPTVLATPGRQDHPSLPGLGMTLGARVLGEFGDARTAMPRQVSQELRRTSPITQASGKNHVVLARYARNRRLADACYLWAFATLTASPGARAFYDAPRAAGDTHNRALEHSANRLVGILHGCLRHHTHYDEHTAWAHRHQLAA